MYGGHNPQYQYPSGFVSGGFKEILRFAQDDYVAYGLNSSLHKNVTLRSEAI